MFGLLLIQFFTAEFGFLVIGHEFDHYPKHRICNTNDWDWLLEEPKNNSDEEQEDSDQRKVGGRRRKKRGKSKVNDDEDWTGESEEDKDQIVKVRKIQRPTYSTRSKGEKAHKGTKQNKSSATKNIVLARAEESENEEDPTLGGFIVGEDDGEIQAEEDLNEEDEEEFDDDEDDD